MPVDIVLRDCEPNNNNYDQYDYLWSTVIEASVYCIRHNILHCEQNLLVITCKLNNAYSLVKNKIFSMTCINNVNRFISRATPCTSSVAEEKGQDCVFEHDQTMRWRSAADEMRTPAE